MAKWGEGDPRWIVEERADATNVNNWHWTEKNATNWSKDKLKELLTDVNIENDEFIVKIKDVSKIEGEASANNRKAKLIFFYEWVINGEWEGKLKNGQNKTVYKGTFEVPNLSEENDPMEVDVNIYLNENVRQEKLKEFMRKQGVDIIREQFRKYILLLKEEFSQGLILPTKNDSSGNLKNETQISVNKKTFAQSSFNNKSSNEKSILDAKTATLKMTEEFKCRARDIYRVFINEDMVKAFTQSSNIEYEPEPGGKFSLFDSNITGYFVEFIENKKIAMNWRNKRWPADVLSLAVLEFEEKEDCAVINLTHSGIPFSFVENTEDGWRNFYWNAIRATFGFGTRLI